jgi:UDP-N-acetylmuramate dehydrogenase
MPTQPDPKTELAAAFGERLRLDEPLARHTSARIGGPAEAFLIAQTIDDLRESARIAWTYDLPLFILGGGSNILFSDGGVAGLVVYNRADGVRFDGTTVTAESGVSTIQLAKRLVSRGLSGFEWAGGVPGTLGGAVYGNAGAHGGDMAGSVQRVEAVIPVGDGVEAVSWSHADLGFEYRSSILKREGRRCVILSMTFDFQVDDPGAIRGRMDAYNDYRKRTQPPGATIGSMFKNPPGDYAGRLIDAAGLKGKQIGGAQISQKHANFFLNVGDATAHDVKALVDLARREVADRFGVTLELEVELVGRWE